MVAWTDICFHQEKKLPKINTKRRKRETFFFTEEKKFLSSLLLISIWFSLCVYILQRREDKTGLIHKLQKNRVWSIFYLSFLSVFFFVWNQKKWIFCKWKIPFDFCRFSWFDFRSHLYNDHSAPAHVFLFRFLKRPDYCLHKNGFESSVHRKRNVTTHHTNYVT